ncbi:MAG: Uma2 family endonuclease [Vulcanimicrobiota bacterium]
MDPAIQDDYPPVPDISHLITEDDEPMDNPFSEKQQRLLAGSLYESWSDEMRQGRPFVAFANVGLFFVPKNPALVPDVMVSLDVSLPADIWEKGNRAYMTWVYGKPPDIVIEIVSNTKGGETERKFKTYGEQGIGYYIIYDPLKRYGSRALRAYQLNGRSYIDLLTPGWLPDALLGLTTWEGEYEGYQATWLRWCDEQGNLLLTGAERAAQSQALAEKAQAEAEKAQAEAEKAQAEAEKAQAEAEKAQAEAEKAQAEARAAREHAAALEERLRRLEEST